MYSRAMPPNEIAQGTDVICNIGKLRARGVCENV